jgi:hypothetical protein
MSLAQLWAALKAWFKFFSPPEPAPPAPHNPNAYFIHLYRYLRSQQSSGTYQYVGLNTSSDLTAKVLQDNGWKAKSVGAVDDNVVDKILFNERPSHLIIKAFWIREEKLELLAQKSSLSFAATASRRFWPWNRTALKS